MKDQAIQYLALDVHQSTVVATVREQGGAIVMRATVPTEARAILRLVRSVGSRVHVTFEEGTQAQWLHDVITPYAERVVVCNTRGEGEGGNKNDQLDADRLSERLRLGSLKSVFHGAKSLLTLKELVRRAAHGSQFTAPSQSLDRRCRWRTHHRAPATTHDDSADRRRCSAKCLHGGAGVSTRRH